MGAAAIRPERADDVSNAGVLCALPALLELGLLQHNPKLFAMRPEFYPLESIFLTMAFIALARVRSLEALRYASQGDWGRILGLDRIPEVQTMRRKLEELSADATKVQQWAVRWRKNG